MKHLTILGIDGCGKTTLMKRIMEKAEIPLEQISIVNSPAFHEGIDVPFRDLSIIMEKFSTLADQLNCYELKGLALYMQVSLFGPVEKFFVEQWKPRSIISQRHPVLDAMVYGKIYIPFLNEKIDSDKYAPILSKELGKDNFNKITRWYNLQKERLGISESFWEFPLKLKQILSSEAKSDTINSLKEHYQTELPNIVAYIDIDPEIAHQRIDKRDEGQTKELHEQIGLLKLLRSEYLGLLEYLNDNFKKIKTAIITLDTYDKIDQLVKEL
jgi:thymidylate kinase